MKSLIILAVLAGLACADPAGPFGTECGAAEQFGFMNCTTAPFIKEIIKPCFVDNGCTFPEPPPGGPPPSAAAGAPPQFPAGGPPQLSAGGPPQMASSQQSAAACFGGADKFMRCLNHDIADIILQMGQPPNADQIKFLCRGNKTVATLALQCISTKVNAMMQQGKVCQFLGGCFQTHIKSSTCQKAMIGMFKNVCSCNSDNTITFNPTDTCKANFPLGQVGTNAIQTICSCGSSFRPTN